MKIFRFATIAAAAIALFSGITSCVKTEFDEPLNNGSYDSLKVNFTIQDLKNLHQTGSGAIEQINDSLVAGGNDIVIGGVVVMDDRSGNYYKTISIQDETGGIDISFNYANLYNQFPVGRKIYIRCKDLYLSDYHNQVQLVGGTYFESGIYQTTGLSELQVRNQIVKGEWSAAFQPAPKKLKISELSTEHLSTLIQLDDVQFTGSDTSQYFSDVSYAHSAVNRTVEDCDGNAAIIRTSGFAKFAGDNIPNGKGSLVGILSVYNNDLQIYIRDLNDVQLTGDRCFKEVATPNTTIAELRALHTSGGHESIDGKVIAGRVIMDDRSGNYYKNFVIQDNTGGIEIKANVFDIFQKYPVGTDVVVDCSGLFLSDYNGLIQIAGDAAGTQLNASQFNANIGAAGTSGQAVPKVTTIKDLDDSMISTLVQLTDVQFIAGDMNKTYANATTQTSVNLKLEDCNGLQVTLRTSGFADFAGQNVPDGKGTLTGVLGVFNGTLQLYIRDENDVLMNNARCGGGGNPNPGTPLTSMNEPFDFIANNVDVDGNGWKSFISDGPRNWQGKTFQTEKFVQATAFVSSSLPPDIPNMETWLISPALDLKVARTLSFQSAQAFYKHDGLKVLISNNFDGSNPAAATWTELDCDLATSANANYAWVESGAISLPVFPSGNGYIAFKYTGSSNANTTTFRIDNVKMN